MIAAKRWIKRFALEIVVFVSSLIIIIPLLMLFFGSFKTSAEAAQFNIKPPTEWHFENYLIVLKSGGIIRSFFNSILITTLSTFITIVISSATAFVIVRRNTKLTEYMYIFFLLGMVAPIQIITTYAVLKILGLLGSFSGIILVYIAMYIPISTFLFSSFIKGIPRELDEAAVIDGCGTYRVFFKIIMPLLKPVIATNVIFVAMGVWNDIMLPIYFLSGRKWTLPLTVYQFFGQYFSDWNLVYADLILASLPVIALFIVAQKYLVSGLTAGSVKG